MFSKETVSLMATLAAVTTWVLTPTVEAGMLFSGPTGGAERRRQECGAEPFVDVNFDGEDGNPDKVCGDLSLRFVCREYCKDDTSYKFTVDSLLEEPLPDTCSTGNIDPSLFSGYDEADILYSTVTDRAWGCSYENLDTGFVYYAYSGEDYEYNNTEVFDVSNETGVEEVPLRFAIWNYGFLFPFDGDTSDHTDVIPDGPGAYIVKGGYAEVEIVDPSLYSWHTEEVCNVIDVCKVLREGRNGDCPPGTQRSSLFFGPGFCKA